MICKLNDLCYIKKSLRPANVGLVVQCKQLLGYYLSNDDLEYNGEYFKAPISDNYWVVTNSSGDIETQFGKSVEAYIPDTWLQPIMGNLLEDEEEIILEIEDVIHV